MSSLLPKPLRFIDLCAGIGGFHYGLSLAQRCLQENSKLTPAGTQIAQWTRNTPHVTFECVMASELNSQRRETYVSNFNGARFKNHTLSDGYNNAGFTAKRLQLNAAALEPECQKVCHKIRQTREELGVQKEQLKKRFPQIDYKDIKVVSPIRTCEVATQDTYSLALPLITQVSKELKQLLPTIDSLYRIGNQKTIKESTLRFLSLLKTLNELDEKHQRATSELYNLFDPTSNQLRAVHGDLSFLINEDKDTLNQWTISSKDDDFIIPKHDLLCAGFPCQPFSKSGYQKGFNDTRGTVWHMIKIILETMKPNFVLLENVGNFAKVHDGHTWERVRGDLTKLGYSNLISTDHVSSKGHGLLSPHHIGLPHHRERFFIFAANDEGRKSLPPTYSFPKTFRHQDKEQQASHKRSMEQIARQNLKRILDDTDVYFSKNPSPDDRKDLEQYASVLKQQERCIKLWQKLLQEIDKLKPPTKNVLVPLPPFPIWGYELDPLHIYPYENQGFSPLELFKNDPVQYEKNRRQCIDEWKAGFQKLYQQIHPKKDPTEALKTIFALNGLSKERQELRSLEGPQRTNFLIQSSPGWPTYIQNDKGWGIKNRSTTSFQASPQPAVIVKSWSKKGDWKIKYIKQNRIWSQKIWACLDPAWLRSWLEDLYQERASYQKLEWNCKNEPLDLYEHLLQFRPSGLRVKRKSCIPAIVACTTTQVPVVSCKKELVTTDIAVRKLMPVDGLLLQGFPKDWQLPPSFDAKFEALGNAVHAELIAEIVLSLFVGFTPLEHHNRQLKLM